MQNPIEMQDPIEMQPTELRRWVLKPKTTDFKFKWSNRKLIAIEVLFSIAVICILIMVPLGYQYVEWNEFAIRKNVASNKVDYENVYGNGQYFWGLARRAIKFKNTVNTVNFDVKSDDALIIFTEAGLELEIDCSFQWVVIKDELGMLYKNYALTYPTQIESIARSILKNVAPQYELEDYYQQRDNITKSMYDSLKTGLREKMNVNVTFFQLNFVTLPNLVLNRLLNIAVQSQLNLKERYVQEAQIIRQTTQTMANEIRANATVINSSAIADASYILQQANAQAFQVIQNAKREAYQSLFLELGLNTTELQLAYIQATGLMSKSDWTLLVDINPIVNLGLN